MSFVVDASVTLAWAFERPNPVEARKAAEVLDRLGSETALVPSLWHLEVLNALLVAERRGVISRVDCAAFLSRLSALSIRTSPDSFEDRREPLLALAREHALTAYDAAYLDLAIRAGSALATFDRRLAAARERAGVRDA